MNKRQQVVRQVLADCANGQFKYGSLDCVQFVNKAVVGITGVDYSEEFDYRLKMEADVFLDNYGGLEGIFTHFLGDPCDHNDLEDGDPCLVELPIVGEVMGMMVSGSVMVKTEEGTISVSAHRIKVGWHVWEQ